MSDNYEYEPSNSIPMQPLPITSQWVTNALPTNNALTIPATEWQVANMLAKKLIDSQTPPPFKISRTTDLTNSLKHSFMVLPDGSVAAMARGKLCNEGILGHGNFGVVRLLQKQDGTTLVVKIEPTNTTKSKDLENEVTDKLKLSLGRFTRERDKTTPWIAGKTVQNKDYFITTRVLGVSWEQYKGEMPALKIAIEAAKSIKMIHEQGILHCDLHKGNIMVNDEAQLVTIIDFGLARPIPTEPVKMESVAVNINIVAPEVAQVKRDSIGMVVKENGKTIFASRRGEFSTAADVYSFCKTLQDAQIVIPGITEANQRLFDILTKGTDINPNNRPNLDEIIKALTECLTARNDLSPKPPITTHFDALTKMQNKANTDDISTPPQSPSPRSSPNPQSYL